MLPQEVQTTLANIEQVELQLLKFKEIENKRDELKSVLYDLMSKYNVDKYITPNGLISFTRVCPTEDKVEVVIDFDIDKLREEDFDTYKKYVVAKEKTIKGRKGYLKTNYINEKESDN